MSEVIGDRPSNTMNRPQSPQRFFLNAPKQKDGECYVLNFDYMELDAYCVSLLRERDRLRAALTTARTAILRVDELLRAHGFEADSSARNLLMCGCPDAALVNGESRSTVETTGEWLTNEQCDDVIAFLEDYEWTGLTRENVRTWNTAIASARASEKASPEPSSGSGCPACGVMYVAGARHFSGCPLHPGEAAFNGSACRSCGHVPAPGQYLMASGNCLVCEAL